MPRREESLILVVDDDDLVRWSLGELLRDEGYRVVYARSGREAVERCAKADVALLDFRLGDIDGLTLAAQIHKRRPGCAFVLVTAEESPDLERRARARGFSGVIAKPFDAGALLAHLGTLLGTEDQRSTSGASAPGRSGPSRSSDERAEVGPDPLRA
jgi:CheY-like chemotaxis protein